MDDRLILAMMLIPVFASALSILPQVHGQIVTNIYVRPDGSIDPVTAPISTKDKVTYVFSNNASAHIVVQRDDVVIDGANYTAQEGIVLSERRNVTIRNTRAVGSIWVAGIYIYNCSDCTISENTLTNNIEGILLYNSSHNNLIGNSVSDNGMSWGRGGVILEHSSYNVLRSNRIANNSMDLNIRSSDLSELIQDIDTSNTIADRPIYYCVNQHGLTIPTDGSYVALVNCTQMTVKNLSLSKNSEGILLANTANSTIAENYIANNINGITLSGSTANKVCDNSIIGNHNGIYATYSDNNTISNNSILRSGSSGSGIQLQTCSNTNISFNTLSEHDNGIILGWCTNTLILSNNITNNNYGLYFLQSSKNHVYHNNFVNNAQQVNMPKYDSNSNFDDGYPSGGNYWSDYAARNPNATEIDNTGIWNTPYVIDDYDVDHFPLTMQYIIPEFPSFLILPLFMIATMLAVIVYGKKGVKTRRN